MFYVFWNGKNNGKNPEDDGKNPWVDGNEPMITVYSDRIKILSRGGLAPLQTKTGFFRGHSVPVNEKLSEIFLQLHISEKTGRGIPVISSEYGEALQEGKGWWWMLDRIVVFRLKKRIYRFQTIYSRKGSCYRRYHKMARYLFQWKTFRILPRSIE